mmetsp:Transcript_73396/g.192451  ORF Transcript_73396/g.192451 Transcript_73396/m.192451 type:complete len:240 (+) Transcript_73396:150-869(+)
MRVGVAVTGSSLMSRTRLEITHVISTPPMSMRTWTAAPPCAGSRPTLSRAMGRMVPMVVDAKTIITSDRVMAKTSSLATLNAKQRTNETSERTTAKHAPTDISWNKIFTIDGFSLALRLAAAMVSCRTTCTALWQPALPPAPTSMVRKKKMVGCTRVSAAKCSRTMEDDDCSKRRRTRQVAREETVVSARPSMSVFASLSASMSSLLLISSGLLSGGATAAPSCCWGKASYSFCLCRLP